MFTANRIFTFDSNTDCFGIAKSHDVEVKYDLDPNDGSVCIAVLFRLWNIKNML